ncbi:hypothetical protein NL676_017986 [Syzygium grande]|nr:hypothetical protein NL676_017986 [Syzygium grande]
MHQLTPKIAPLPPLSPQSVFPSSVKMLASQAAVCSFAFLTPPGRAPRLDYSGSASFAFHSSLPSTGEGRRGPEREKAAPSSFSSPRKRAASPSSVSSQSRKILVPDGAFGAVPGGDLGSDGRVPSPSLFFDWLWTEDHVEANVVVDVIEAVRDAGEVHPRHPCPEDREIGYLRVPQ